MPKTVAATQFKAQCLAYLDRVASRRVSIVISKHGRPVARLVPIEETAPSQRRPLVGSVTLVDPDDDLSSTNVRWEAGAPRR